MKRDIKFRFWDTKHKWMDAPDGHNLYLTNDGIVEVYEAGCWDRYLERDWDSEDRYVIMQFTGLKDKSGIELYEGDICKDMDDGLYVIEFDEAEFTSIYNTNVREYLSETHDQIEVIGNIYENPELLTS